MDAVTFKRGGGRYFMDGGENRHLSVDANVAVVR